MKLFPRTIDQWFVTAAAGIAFILCANTSASTTIFIPLASVENFSGPGADPFAIPSLPLSPQWRL